ncbi:transposase [Haloferula chungangensis]|uniref:Transposase n=1 Tax=Haloferula chungangensis TaxID=1048331 RepID=A0ABW2L7I2_9BACT
MPYQWRNLTPAEREKLLAFRKRLRRPWHRPPHFGGGSVHYHLTAACYEHKPIIGHSPERLEEFTNELLNALPIEPAAWCILPNHYHLLIRCDDLKNMTRTLGQLHGRLSFRWNGEDGTRGRKVWYSVADRAMRGSEHYWATLNYIHHNPVKHGYTDNWLDWPFSSAQDYLNEVGRAEAIKIWKNFPILDYGKGWDDL